MLHSVNRAVEPTSYADRGKRASIGSTIKTTRVPAIATNKGSKIFCTQSYVSVMVRLLCETRIFLGTDSLRNVARIGDIPGLSGKAQLSWRGKTNSRPALASAKAGLLYIFSDAKVSFRRPR